MSRHATRSAPGKKLAAKRKPVAHSARRAAARGGAGAASVEKLTDRAYERIEELIVTLSLPPGQAVSEYQLSEQLGIGRTPVREALQRLAREKLVLILPRRGVIVSEINVKEQLRLLEVRREVERLVARSAARRATDEERARFAALARTFTESGQRNDDVTFLRADREFNDLCLHSARNDFASGAMSLMNGLSRRFWYLHYKQAADLPQTAKGHAAIAQAIAEGDEAGAARALDALLDNIEQFTRATLSLDFPY